jgi:hypothetical protein
VRFITFETLVTGVRAFECAFSMRTSSFVHGLMTRRAVFAFTVLTDFVPLTVFFKALGIIQVLHLNAAQIGMRCGDKKVDSLTYSTLSDNWYVIVLPGRGCRAIRRRPLLLLQASLGAQASLAIDSRLLAKRGGIGMRKYAKIL